MGQISALLSRLKNVDFILLLLLVGFVILEMVILKNVPVSHVGVCFFCICEYVLSCISMSEYCCHFHV